MKRYSLPKTKRVLTDRQFRAVIGQRLFFRDGPMTVYMAANDCGFPRLGVSIRKSTLSAVSRNRLKRLVREAFRLNQHDIPAGFDYLVMISPRQFTKNRDTADMNDMAAELTFEQVSEAFLSLVKKLASKVK